MIKMMYFAFTSLSTVGFGDFCPRGNIERLLGAMMLLFGVAIFSYIMGKFIEMIEKLQLLNQELEEEDKLSCFFNVIKHFNYNRDLKDDLKANIEIHFKHKWMKDRTQAFRDPEDVALYEQLPEEVQYKLFRECLFSEFIKAHKKYFTFQKTYSNIKYNFYSWNDQPYA